MAEQTPNKNIDFNSLPRGAISIKGLPLSRNTRLPSIRTPRDLTLGAQPKRVFTPNIPVRREKKVSVPTNEISQPSTQRPGSTSKKAPPVSPKGKQRPRNFIQTEGCLFGEGLAPTTSQNNRQKESVPRFSSSKPVVKKEFDMSDVNSGIDEILRDDFIDDDDDYDETEDIKPIIYPYQDSVEKNIKKLEPVKQTFENNDFAKELGFDVNKIAKFIKKEKGMEEVTKPIEDNDMDSQNEMLQLFKKENPELLLFQFPKTFTFQHTEEQTRESSSTSAKSFSKEQCNTKIKNKNGLSSFPEGHVGKLQILKSGRARLVVGGNYFYLNCANALKNKHEAVFIKTDSDNKDIIVLGNIERKLTITPDVNTLLHSKR